MSSPYYQTKHWRALRAKHLAEHPFCIVVGCNRRAVVVDHIEGRPNVPYPTDADRLDNLRSLCLQHDAQVKERGGIRKSGGRFRVTGCDAAGRSLDPRHAWNR